MAVVPLSPSSPPGGAAEAPSSQEKSADSRAVGGFSHAGGDKEGGDGSPPSALGALREAAGSGRSSWTPPTPQPPVWVQVDKVFTAQRCAFGGGGSWQGTDDLESRLSPLVAPCYAKLG